jgi:hypothetical protein
MFGSKPNVGGSIPSAPAQTTILIGWSFVYEQSRKRVMSPFIISLKRGDGERPPSVFVIARPKAVAISRLLRYARNDDKDG